MQKAEGDAEQLEMDMDCRSAGQTDANQLRSKHLTLPQRPKPNPRQYRHVLTYAHMYAEG